MKTGSLFKPLLIFCFASLVRLIFVSQWQHLPYAQTPYLDALSYLNWARQIASGHLLKDSVFYQSPLYPYVLGLLFKIFGVFPHLASIFQALLDGLTCVLLSQVADESFGRRAGWVTGLLAALYAPMIFYTAPLMKETLGLFLLSLFLLLLLRGLAKSSLKTIALAGLSLGLATLVRSNFLILALASVGVLAFKFRQSRGRALLGFVIFYALAILPATIHNRVVGQDWVMVTSAGGFNFYIGNWDGAGGSSQYPPEVSTDPAREQQDTQRLAMKAIGHVLLASEVSDFWFQKGLAWAFENPATELHLLLEKVKLYWNNFEPPDNYDVSFIRSQFSTILTLPLVGFALVSTLAMFALPFVIRVNSCARILLVFEGAYFLSVLPFYITDRYRLPAVVFLLPLAGAAPQVAKLLWQQRPGRIAGLCMASALAFFGLGTAALTDNSALNSYNWGLVASLYADAGLDTKATEAMEKAKSAEPFGATGQAMIKAAEAYERLGELSQAESLFKLSTKAYPKDGLTFHNLGRFYKDHDQLKEAKLAFETSIQVSPWQYQPYVGLALTLIQLGDKSQAAWTIQQGERLAPEAYNWDHLRELVH